MKNVVILAGIVTFNPDLERLKENISAITEQVQQVLIVDNGSNNILEIKLMVKKFDPKVRIIEFKNNLGIAAALNVIGDYAVGKGFDYFLTLDQDSVSLPGVIEQFKKYLYLPKVGLLNTYHIDRNRNDSKIPNAEVIEEPEMITSGSLMSTSLFAKGFKYDSDLFIDKVDFDLNIRLISAGYHLYQIPYYGLLHELGEMSERRFLFWRVSTHNHSAFRRYYMSRNAIIMFKKYGVTNVNLKLLRADIIKIIKTLLYEKDKKNKIKNIIKGYIDGLGYKN